MVTVREFARQVGKSHVLILKLAGEGIIPRNADGTIPLAEGLRAFQIYDAAPKSKGGRPKKGEEKPKTIKPKFQKIEKKKPAVEVKKEAPSITKENLVEEKIHEEENTKIDVPALNNPNAANAIAINAAMNKAKLAEKTYQARLKELDYKMKTGELVEKTAVASEAQWLAEQIKSKLLSIPPRISSMCEGRIAREIEEIVSDAINNALKELQKCKYKSE